MDAVYFFRHVPPGAGRLMTEELRYSLRSLATNMPGLGQVHVFGGRAGWFSPHVEHYPVSQGVHKHENTWKIWRQIASAARAGYLPEWFMIMNDDYFLMRPLDGDVPPYSAGMLASWIDQRRDHQHIREAATRTARWLAAQGIPLDAQVCYELHMPFVCHGPTLAAVWPELDRAADRGRMASRMIKRSPIGNLTPGLNDRAQLVTDGKVIRRGDPMPAGPWLSTSDDAFARRGVHEAGVEIRASFPRPSRFESGPEPAQDPRRAPGAPRLVRA